MTEESERVSPTSVSFKAFELEAVRFVQALHDPKYSGVTDVLRDFSVNQCVQIKERAAKAA